MKIVEEGDQKQDREVENNIGDEAASADSYGQNGWWKR